MTVLLRDRSSVSRCEYPARPRGQRSPVASRVAVRLDPHALSHWDEAVNRWVTPRGRVPVYVGSSVEDIRLTGSVRIR